MEFCEPDDGSLLMDGTWNFPANSDFQPLKTHHSFTDYYSYLHDDLGALHPFFDSPSPRLRRFPDDGDAIFLESWLQGTPEHSSTSATGPNADNCSGGGGKRSKNRPSKRVEGQPSKNLMAERRRRKRLNDRLFLLRSIVPKISKMDRTSILGDTIDYVKELMNKIRTLREDAADSCFDGVMSGSIQEDDHGNDSQLKNLPKFEVERRKQDTKLEIMCCEPKPGLLLSTLTTLDALGLDIQQCVITCFADFSLRAACSEVAKHRTHLSPEDVKQALVTGAGYGGRNMFRVSNVLCME